MSEAPIINVPAGTYALRQTATCIFHVSPAPNDTVTFPTTSLCVSRSMTLVGAGAATTVIDGEQPPGQLGVGKPVMYVSAGTAVEIQGVTMKRGNFSVGSLTGHGGGIRTAGALTLTETVVSDNFTGGPGGGIYNTGNLALVRSTLTRNSTPGDGGGLFNTDGGTVTVGSSLITANTTTGGSGGGLSNFSGTVTISGSTISVNVAENGAGGGLHSGSFTAMFVTNATISGNRARSGGGLMNGFAATMHLQNV
ncbi:MAG TPA: hypothetical protein VFG86_14330, partial [Chloroflexota bacterium]|nr:hypothetical protein [Chloroflexota bacterium]